MSRLPAVRLLQNVSACFFSASSHSFYWGAAAGGEGYSPPVNGMMLLTTQGTGSGVIIRWSEGD